MLFSGDN